MEVPEKVVNTLNFSNNEVINVVKYSSDSNYCMVGGANKVVELVNPTKQLKLKVYSGHAGEITDVLSSCDNSRIFSSSTDRSVNEWDVLRGVCVGRYRKHFNMVSCIAQNEESTVLVSGSVDNKVCVWDVREKKLIQTLEEAKDSVTKVVLSGSLITSASLDNCVRSYDVRTGRVIEDCVGYGVLDCEVVFNCKAVVCLYRDESEKSGAIKVIDIGSGGLLKKMNGLGEGLKGLVVVNNDKFLGVCEGNCVAFYSIETGRLVKKVGFKEDVKSVCMDYNREGRRQMVVAGGNVLKLFSV